MSVNNTFTPGNLLGIVPAKYSCNNEINIGMLSRHSLAPACTYEKKTNEDGVSTYTLNCIILVAKENVPVSTDNNPDGEINFSINIMRTDVNRLSFYVSKPNSFTQSSSFYLYIVPIVFQPSVFGISDLKRIKVYNWDADPEGSRGTEIDVD